MSEVKQYQIVVADIEKASPVQRIVTLSSELMDDDAALEAYLGKLLAGMIEEIK